MTRPLDPKPARPHQRKAGLGETMKAVAWSFFGIRRSADYERDVQRLNPDRGKIKTPHLDKLAAQGMTFTDAHSG